MNATAVISPLTRDTAWMLAVEILLAEPETLGDDVLESCLDLLRERPRALGDVRSPEYLGYRESIAPQP